MTVNVTKRDYSLVGLDARLAEEKGLAAAEWYSCPIAREDLKELMKRKDAPGIRDTLILFGSLGASGYLGYHFWGTWLAVPFFIAYGVLYGPAWTAGGTNAVTGLHLRRVG